MLRVLLYSIKVMSSVDRRKKYSKRSDAIRRDELIQQVKEIINYGLNKSMRIIIMQLKGRESIIRCVEHKDTKSYIMKKGQ